MSDPEFQARNNLGGMFVDCSWLPVVPETGCLAILCYVKLMYVSTRPLDSRYRGNCRQPIKRLYPVYGGRMGVYFRIETPHAACTPLDACISGSVWPVLSMLLIRFRDYFQIIKSKIPT